MSYTCMHSDGAVKVIRSLKSLSQLRILNLSGNNLNEKVVNDLVTTITNSINLVKLYIADNYLGAIGITEIAKALLANPKGLKVLDFTNNDITSEAAESIAEVILANPSLESLLLGEGCSQLRNAMKTKEVNGNAVGHISAIQLNETFIAKHMLRIKEDTKVNGTLYSFCYSVIDTSNYCYKVFEISQGKYTDGSTSLLQPNYNNLQSDGIKRICKAFSCVTSLDVLSIEKNHVDDEAANSIATALVSNIGIKQLWIGENYFTPNGISTILQPFIQEHLPTLKSRLEVLDLSYCNLSVKKTVCDISSVLLHTKLKQLWLEGNNLSSQDIATLVSVLKNCMDIILVSLRGNNINEEAANILSKVLLGKYGLQQLYLGNNQLEDRGMIKITEALNTTHGLLTLDLMNNNISEAAADALTSVITNCRLLEQLYLGGNKLLSTGTTKIVTAIQQAACRSTLRVLDLSNNGIGSDERVADEISRAVGNTELLTVLLLDDNAFSVDGLLKITRSLGQSESAEYIMIFSVMHNDVMISEEAKDEMREVMADQQLADCVMYF